MSAPPGPLRLGTLTLDPERGLLLDAAGVPVALRPQAWRLLHTLARAPGRLHSKHELLDAVWPGIVVTEDSLVQAVGDIRQALGPTGRDILRTVHGRGYMLVPDALVPSHEAGAGDTGGPVRSPRVTGRTGALPSIDDPLIGRSGDLAAIRDALAHSRVVTLIGVGGIGKTRLALEVAAATADAFADGAYWVDLSVATASEAVLPVVMTAVGARETLGRAGVHALCDHLVGQTALVLLDNCEHVLAAVADLVEAVRGAAPRVRLLCTSREALGVRGEHLLPVGSLAGAEAAELFKVRATAARPGFEADATLIGRICVRLDGIPLAIELAAARCRSMSPAEIDGLLDHRFRLLRGGRSGPERHRALQAAIDWSYALLDARERVVFDRMAVFSGGSLVDGLAQVCEFDELDTLDILDRLVARSMVVVTNTPLGSRYHQLETLRQYAEDRLIEAGGVARTQERHFDWLSRLAARCETARGIDAEAQGFKRVAAEIDNLRAAVSHAIAAGRNEPAHRIVDALGRYITFLPAYEIPDWIRPIQLEGDSWTTTAANCAALGEHADFQRGRPGVALSSFEEVPAWFHAASASRQAHVASVHLQRGGNPRVALDMLDRCQPVSDVDHATVARVRLFAAAMWQPDASLRAQDTDNLPAIAAASIASARAAGNATELAFLLLMAAIAVWRRDRELARAYRQEAASLARTLHAGIIMMVAERSAIAIQHDGLLSAEALRNVRDMITNAWERGQKYQGFLAVAMTFPTLIRLDPAVAAQFWMVVKRDFGFGNFAVAAIVTPEDIDDLERRWRAGGNAIEEISMDDACMDVIAVIDRAIASGADSTAGVESQETPCEQRRLR